MKTITRKLRCGAKMKIEALPQIFGNNTKYLAVTVVCAPDDEYFARSFKANSLEEVGTVYSSDGWSNSVRIIVGVNNLRILRNTIDRVLENLKKG